MSTDLLPGFDDPVRDSQQSYRAILNAFGYPGSHQRPVILEEAPAPLMPATASILLTLADQETPVWLDPTAETPAVRSFLSFHATAPVTDKPEHAVFAVIADATSFEGFGTFGQGDHSYPDRSTTVILQVASLEGGSRITLSGPGIKESTTVSPKGLPQSFLQAWGRNRLLFPCGVDVILTSGRDLLALPRTVRADEGE